VRVVEIFVCQTQVILKPGGKLGCETNLHWASVGLLVMESHQHSLSMFHIYPPSNAAAKEDRER
jgi:hypothetical protein